MTNKNDFDGNLQNKGGFSAKAKYDICHQTIDSAILPFLDPQTNELKKEFTKERACPLCLSSSKRPLFKKNGFPHVSCNDCSFVYVSTILKDELIEAHYRNISNDWTTVTETPEYRKRQDAYSNFHLDHIERLLKTSDKNILDIGCNAGDFLVHARNRGWSIAGHELNTSAIKVCKEKGIEILSEDLNDTINSKRKFSAVTFFGVLEHLIHPKEVLGQAYCLLDSGGVLAVLVPNIDGLATRTLQERSRTFDGIEHLNFWNRSTMIEFLESGGFKVEHTETAISELYTFNNYISFDNPYGASKEYEFVIPELTPEIIHKNYLGHHLLAYATKRV